jgi:pyruvate/2-oxoglutarate dehydrogenase complex dihydrolipoamide dehydrogenase (E3) component
MTPSYGTVTNSVAVDMATVRRREREMVERQIARHLQNYKVSGAELVMGSGRFVAPKILEVSLNDGGTRVLAADKVFLNVGPTLPFQAFPASMLRDRSPMSRLWNSTTCHRIWS